MALISVALGGLLGGITSSLLGGLPVQVTVDVLTINLLLALGAPAAAPAGGTYQPLNAAVSTWVGETPGSGPGRSCAYGDNPATWPVIARRCRGADPTQPFEVWYVCGQHYTTDPRLTPAYNLTAN